MPKNKTSKKFPLVIRKAIENLPRILKSPRLLYSQNRSRRANSQRLESIKSVLVVMLDHCCLQHDAIPVHIVQKSEAVPYTIQEIADEAGLCRKTVQRTFDDLKDAGFLQVSYQKKCGFNGDILVVAVTLKQFTKLFWQTLGLYSLYVEAVKYAQSQKPIRLRVRIFQVAGAAREFVHGLIQRVRSRQAARTLPPPKEDDATRQQNARSCLETRAFRMGNDCMQCDRRYLCKAICRNH